MATALEHAYQDTRFTIVDFNYAREALSRAMGVPREPAPLDGDQLDVPYWGRHFMEWNDTPWRTKADAIDMLKKASATAIQLSKTAAAK